MPPAWALTTPTPAVSGVIIDTQPTGTQPVMPPSKSPLATPSLPEVVRGGAGVELDVGDAVGVFGAGPAGLVAGAVGVRLASALGLGLGVGDAVAGGGV